ncbi:MAG: hypothetical protein AAF821_26165 [Cyanobacteria bacterium P01_D01_bin.156]
MSTFNDQVWFKRDACRKISACEKIVWALDLFTSAHAQAELLQKFHKEQGHEYALSAFWRAMVLEYAKVFTETRSGQSRVGFSDKYLTRNEKFDQKTHDEIMELRHTCVAHSDEKLEPQSMCILLTCMTSPKPLATKHDAIYLPIQFQCHSSSVWYTEDTEWIEKVVNHCDFCAKVTQDELSRHTKELQQYLLQNARWANQLDSCLLYEKPSRTNIESHTEPVMPRNEASLKLKCRNKTFHWKSVFYQNVPKLDEEYEGDGFTIKSRSDAEKRVINYTVKYDDYHN